MIGEILLGVGVLSAVLMAAAIIYLRHNLTKVKDEKKALVEKFKKLQFQKKSSEVRLGKIGENMAPLLEEWPYDPNKFRFLGDPIDGIAFEDDEIILFEFKTGGARLSKTQKHIKNLVKEGKVRFGTFRISEKGCKLKID